MYKIHAIRDIIRAIFGRRGHAAGGAVIHRPKKQEEIWIKLNEGGPVDHF